MRQAKNGTQVLKAVKWILENVGWVQKHFSKMGADGKPIGYCLAGALSVVECPYHAYVNASGRLHQYLPENFHSIIYFNDHKLTTKEDVISLIDRTLKKGSQ